MPPVYVIFFTRDDVRKKNKALSRIRRQWDDGDDFGDKTELIYVNGAYRDVTTAIGRLISDFHCIDPNAMQSTILAKRANFLKSNEEEACKMVGWVEEYAEKKRNEGMFYNTVEHVKQIMNNANLSAEKALELIGVPKADFAKYLAVL